MTRSASNQPARRKPWIIASVVVLLLAASAYLTWSAGNKPVKPWKRTAFDFLVTWRCLECGYEEQGPAGVGPRTCPRCGKDQLYVCIRHVCPRHGVFPVAFQYDQEGNPVKLKVADGPWVPYADQDYNVNARCPRCGAFMMPSEAPRPAPRKP